VQLIGVTLLPCSVLLVNETADGYFPSLPVEINLRIETA